MLITSLGGRFKQIPGDDVVDVLLRFARTENANQMVLGASRHGWPATMFTGRSVPTRLAHRAGEIDVHLVGRTSHGAEDDEADPVGPRVRHR